MNAKNPCLTYDTPASAWHDALPLGNGFLGAMVYGHVGTERIMLNEDSLWYGQPMDRNNPAYREKLPIIRDCVLDGRIREAEAMILQCQTGSPQSMRHYVPLGELNLALGQTQPFSMGWIPHSEGSTDYSRKLDLMHGILQIQHRQDGTSYRREMFTSHPARVLAMHLESDQPEAIDLDLLLNRVPISDAVSEDDRQPGKIVSHGDWPVMLADQVGTLDDQTLMLRGNDAGTQFVVALRVVCDGKILNPVTQLLVRNAQNVKVYLAAATSNRCQDPLADVLARLDVAQAKGYARLRQEHVQDFSAWMSRCILDLGPAPEGTTDKRLEAVRQGASDPALAATYFQMSRYLMVSGSREGSAPLNLQGIWNADFTPMWDSKYTLNINLQMNYWLAETTGLSKMHLPLMDLLEVMHARGKETAKVMYGMRGMVCHHNTDLYGDCAPQDRYMAATPWVTGGAWLGLHVWQHYQYTQDTKVLRRMLPVLKDLCLFYCDYLFEHDGRLITCPSVSPENRYVLPDGYDTPLCQAPAMDHQILREFFAACIQIFGLLQEEADLSVTLGVLVQRLPQDKIGAAGQLMEWEEDFPELTARMGHVSHLFGCYPGQSISWQTTPETMQAVKKSLQTREDAGAGERGWPLAWFINLHARLLEKDKTDQGIQTMIAHSTARNLFNVGRVFQIDGNMGTAAGMVECLLQSHDAIHFLPALPRSWQEGSVKGLRARGGHEIDLSWQDGALAQASLKAGCSGRIEVADEPLGVTLDQQPVQVTKTTSGFSFLAQQGKTYQLTPRP